MSINWLQWGLFITSELLGFWLIILLFLIMIIHCYEQINDSFEKCYEKILFILLPLIVLFYLFLIEIDCLLMIKYIPKWFLK